MRLGIIAVAGVIAVTASYVRQRREQQFQQAQRAAAEAEFLRLQASHDDLTGLLNRRGFFERLQTEAFGEGTIVVIDCDDFKDVNDEHGHQVGDEFLKGLAGRLSSGVSRADLIARWGGDEFLLLLRVPFVDGTSVARRVVDEAMARPMSTSVGGHPGLALGGRRSLRSEQGPRPGHCGCR